jgi:hypothetical protein
VRKLELARFSRRDAGRLSMVHRLGGRLLWRRRRPLAVLEMLTLLFLFTQDRLLLLEALACQCIIRCSCVQA